MSNYKHPIGLTPFVDEVLSPKFEYYLVDKTTELFLLAPDPRDFRSYINQTHILYGELAEYFLNWGRLNVSVEEDIKLRTYYRITNLSIHRILSTNLHSKFKVPNPWINCMQINRGTDSKLFLHNPLFAAPPKIFRNSNLYSDKDETYGWFVCLKDFKLKPVLDEVTTLLEGDREGKG